MIVGSYRVKNLRLHWHHGERWFWDTFVDADLANNSALCAIALLAGARNGKGCGTK